MVRRVSRSSFMGGTWVFPGGAVDAVDHSDLAMTAVAGNLDSTERPWRAAALRELAEEAGVWLTDPPIGTIPAPGRDEAIYAALIAGGARFDAGNLLYFANWVTPAQVPIRFDTRFFAAWVPPTVAAIADGTEVDAVAWVRPRSAIARGATGEWVVPFPTVRTLGVIGAFTDPETTRTIVAGLGPIPRIEPKIVVADDGTMRVVMPDDEDYALPGAPPGSVVLPGATG